MGDFIVSNKKINIINHSFEDDGGGSSSWINFLKDIKPTNANADNNLLDTMDKLKKVIPATTTTTTTSQESDTPITTSPKPESYNIRKLRFKKNRFSLENQDYNSSLKLKIATEEIDKLIFFLNTPRDTPRSISTSSEINISSDNILPTCCLAIQEIKEEDEDQFNNINNTTAIHHHSVDEASNNQHVDENGNGIIEIKQIDYNRISQSLEIIHLNSNHHNLNDDDSNTTYSTHSTSTSTTSSKNKENEEFISIVETFMKLDDQVVIAASKSAASTEIHEEIKVDHLIELSIESLDECEICCNTEVQGYDVFKFSPCDHRYCVDCIRKYFTDLIYRQSEVTCPHPKCNSGVSDFKIKEIVGPTIFKKFELYKYLKSFKGDNILYCIECQTPIPYKSIAAKNCTGDKVTIIKCDQAECGTEHCMECLLLAHPDKTCKENQQAIRESMSIEELKTLEFLELNTSIKKCPKCGISTSKLNGCEYVMCLTCNYQFCFLCLEPHDHNLGTHIHGKNYIEHSLDHETDNYYYYLNQRNKHRKLKKVCKTILIGGGILIATPIVVAGAIVVALPYLVYFGIKKNKERKKKKKNKSFLNWTKQEVKKREAIGLEIAP